MINPIRFLIAVLIFPFCAAAQFTNLNIEKELWYQGSIQLMSGEKLKGELNYNLVTEVLQFHRGTNTQTYSAENVVHFTLKDSLGNAGLFYSIPFDIHYSGRRKPTFFKVQHENQSMAILLRYEFAYKKILTAHEIMLRGLVFGKRSHTVNKDNLVREIVYIVSSKGPMVTFMQSSSENNYTIFNGRHALKKSGGYNLSDNFDGLKGNAGLKKLIGKDSRTMQKITEEQKIDIMTLNGLEEYIDFYNQLPK